MLSTDCFHSNDQTVSPLLFALIDCFDSTSRLRTYNQLSIKNEWKPFPMLLNITRTVGFPHCLLCNITTLEYHTFEYHMFCVYPNISIMGLHLPRERCIWKIISSKVMSLLDFEFDRSSPIKAFHYVSDLTDLASKRI